MTVMTCSMLRDLDRLLQILKTNMFALSQIVCTVFYNFIFQTGMMLAAWALTIVHLNAPAPEQLSDAVTPSWRRYPRVFQPRHLNSTLMSTRSDPSTLRDWSIWNLWQDCKLNTIIQQQHRADQLSNISQLNCIPQRKLKCHILHQFVNVQGSSYLLHFYGD